MANSRYLSFVEFIELAFTKCFYTRFEINPERSDYCTLSKENL